MYQQVIQKPTPTTKTSSFGISTFWKQNNSSYIEYRINHRTGGVFQQQQPREQKKEHIKNMYKY